MKKRTARAAAEIIGAVVGAGFASGREIEGFFTRFGPWGWLGVAAASGAVGFVSLNVMCRGGAAGMPEQWRNTFMEKLWHGAFTLLMAATGGAMLAASGEIAALMIPFHQAYAGGFILTLVLAWLLAGRERQMLPAVSRLLIVCLAAMLLAGVLLPANPAALVREEPDWRFGAWGILYGLSYGGFNVALAAPLLALVGDGLPEKEKRRCAVLVGIVLMVLLGLGNAVLLRHTALRGESLPFICLLGVLGRTGYVLGGAALYLAVLTTLTAALRGMQALLPADDLWQLGGMAAIVLVALGGFESIVSMVYPFMGGGCFLLLMAAQGAHERRK